MCKKDLVLCDSLLHVPLIFSLPSQLKKDGRTNVLAEEVNVLPTILDLMGIDIPFGVQGKSLTMALTGESDHHKDAVYSEKTI